MTDYVVERNGLLVGAEHLAKFRSRRSFEFAVGFAHEISERERWINIRANPPVRRSLNIFAPRIGCEPPFVRQPTQTQT
jgi:hypothetical protein